MKFLKLIFLISLIGNSYIHGAAAAAIEKKTVAEVGVTSEATHYEAEATAKMWECLNNPGSGAVIHTLLSKKADPNARRKDGLSPLAKAIHSNSLATVNYLLEHKADPMKSMFENGTMLPIHIAAYLGSQKTIVRVLLLSNPGSVNAKGEEYRTPLMEAVRGGHFELQKFLHDAGADANLKDFSGESAFSMLAKKMSDLCKE